MLMRKFAALFLVLSLIVIMAGCGISVSETELYRGNTVIYIPADPTTKETETIAPVTTDTVAVEPSETETTAESAPETTKATTPKKTSASSGKKTEPTTVPATEVTTAPTTEPVTEATTVPTAEAETMPSETPAETKPPVYDISGYTVGGLEMAMMDEINGYRAVEGLRELGKDTRLCAIASARAYEVSQSWSHTRPNGTSYTTVFGDYGFSCGASAENLLYTSGGEDAAALVARWMSADGNRSALMNSGFCTVGIGIYCADGFTYIACLVVA